MAVEENVKITGEPGVKNQFGKGLSYHADAVAPMKVAAASAAVLSVAVAAVVLSGAPEKPAEPAGVNSIFLGAQVPMTEAQTIVEIPLLKGPGDASLPFDHGRKPTGRTVIIRFGGPEVHSRPRPSVIPPGSLLEAVLSTGASNGPVRAMVKRALTLNGETLIEEGAILLGTGSSTDDRLLIRFSKVVYEDGTHSEIQAQAADPSDKIPGLKGSKIGNHALRLAAGMGLNFVGGMSEGLQESEVQQGAVIKKSTVKNALLNGAQRSAIEQSQEAMTSLRNERPIIEVPEGTEIYVLFGDG